MLQKQRVLVRCTSFTWDSELWKKYLQFPWIVQVGGKETMDRKHKIYTHELRLLFVSDLPNGSILKMLSLNRIQLEDLNLCKKIYNDGAVELTVHISKCCVCFLFTPLCIVHMSIYHVHLKMCRQAKSSSNAKRENTFLLLSPFSREL